MAVADAAAGLELMRDNTERIRRGLNGGVPTAKWLPTPESGPCTTGMFCNQKNKYLERHVIRESYLKISREQHRHYALENNNKTFFLSYNTTTNKQDSLTCYHNG